MATGRVDRRDACAGLRLEAGAPRVAITGRFVFGDATIPSGWSTRGSLLSRRVVSNSATTTAAAAGTGAGDDKFYFGRVAGGTHCRCRDSLQRPTAAAGRTEGLTAGRNGGAG